jgi:hypothetical protein
MILKRVRWELVVMIKVEVQSSIIVPAEASKSYAGACSKCGYVLPPLNIAAPIFFERGSVTCERCNSEVDLWQAALQHSFSWDPVSLGASNIAIVKDIETGQSYRLDLTDHGAPADARILRMVYTGQGGPDGAVTVVERHSNVSHHRYFGAVVNLLGIPIGEGKEPRTGKVAIWAKWIHREESEAWPYLVSAIESLVTQDYSSALVFAHSAVEISLMPLIAQRFERFASRERVDNLISGDLGYSHALNVVLPYMCGQLGVRQLPNEIRGALNSLNTRRNKIVHRGVKSQSIPEKEAMEGMTAAAFGFEYLRYIAPQFERTA